MTYRTGIYDSKHWHTKAPGHREEATKDNHIGASNTLCSWKYEIGIENKVNLLNICYPKTMPIDSPSTYIVAKGDSSATNYYLCSKDAYCLLNK